MTRRALLRLLADNADGVYRYNPDSDHQLAERLLLRLLRDSVISAAWDDASDQWWYA